MRPIQLALALLMTSGLAAIGCSAASDDLADEGVVADGEDELKSAAWEKLVGAYDVSDAPVRPPTLQHIVFSRDPRTGGHRFFADVDTGIRCFRAPCPSTARVEGAFTATSRTLRLIPEGADAVALGGRYGYTLRGEKLELTKSGVATKLGKREGTYCAQAEDCFGQDFIHPMCMGRFTCTADQSCGFKCGIDISKCPEIVQPPPNFCPAGQHLSPRHDFNGCTVGFDCN